MRSFYRHVLSQFKRVSAASCLCTYIVGCGLQFQLFGHVFCKVRFLKCSVINFGSWSPGKPWNFRQDLFEFEVHDNDGNYATKLITQFNGREIDTASCLAFAPKRRTGQRRHR